MKQQPPQNDYELNSLFSTPIYSAVRDWEDLDSKQEEAEVENIIKEGMLRSAGNSQSINSYIFNDKLKNIKQFCEQQIKIYVEQVISPKEKLDFYITQSWLNITKPGEYHHEHSHSNSIISGVFYISTEEDDNITFHDPNDKLKKVIVFEPKEYNIWNSPVWSFSVNTNDLILFPSWLDHMVDPNPKATTDRISISFNTFVRGTFGARKDSTELIL